MLIKFGIYLVTIEKELQPKSKIGKQPYMKFIGKCPIIVSSAIDAEKYKRWPNPATFKFYDFSKGGTDIVDQRGGFTAVDQNQSTTPVVLKFL